MWPAFVLGGGGGICTRYGVIIFAGSFSEHDTIYGAATNKHRSDSRRNCTADGEREVKNSSRASGDFFNTNLWVLQQRVERHNVGKGVLFLG